MPDVFKSDDTTDGSYEGTETPASSPLKMMIKSYEEAEALRFSQASFVIANIVAFGLAFIAALLLLCINVWGFPTFQVFVATLMVIFSFTSLALAFTFVAYPVLVDLYRWQASLKGLKVFSLITVIWPLLIVWAGSVKWVWKLW
ncbi:hypothetical protein QJS04_geneDACA019101 [Acorus gramineus]|uniref:Uncharacterized protein n=1 Tax=Acorus gramineus TaxID=55184 RepID=A0AAV9A9A1_ACOGR|nr:hypothetical protein QJS04_geneDACA019101 [Acorus gramineus]